MKLTFLINWRKNQNLRCSHNMDTEEIMSMFSAAKQCTPNSTMSYLWARLRATKNETVDFLDSLEEAERERSVSRSISVARKAQIKHRITQKRYHGGNG